MLHVPVVECTDAAHRQQKMWLLLVCSHDLTQRASPVSSSEGGSASPSGSHGQWQCCTGAVHVQGDVRESPHPGCAEHIRVRDCRFWCLATCIAGHCGPDGKSACRLHSAFKRKEGACGWHPTMSAMLVRLTRHMFPGR